MFAPRFCICCIDRALLRCSLYHCPLIHFAPCASYASAPLGTQIVFNKLEKKKEHNKQTKKETHWGKRKTNKQQKTSLAQGEVVQAMVDYVDVTPTLVEAAGGGAIDGLDGSSFLGVLRGTRDEHNSYSYAFRPARGPSVRRERAMAFGQFGAIASSTSSTSIRRCRTRIG